VHDENSLKGERLKVLAPQPGLFFVGVASSHDDRGKMPLPQKKPDFLLKVRRLVPIPAFRALSRLIHDHTIGNNYKRCQRHFKS
jgi:hypothetical protein